MKKNISILLLSVAFNFLNAQTYPTGLVVNDKAPEFTAKDQNNKSVTLTNLIKKGPIVIVFYRGEWCPYCNKQLKNLEDSLTLIVKKGATLIAITPETRENVDKTITKTKLTYSVLSDDSLKIMNAYKVAFTLDAKTTEKYKGYGISLNERNGSNGNNLPVPAVYVINKEGKITYSYFDKDYRNRVSVKEIVSHL
ncbi:MAG: peroxiredoxin-like family protein [Bacteroidota bacterium]|nr:peroxiredoxin-like family protein [Bacteroidota bacterium]